MSITLSNEQGFILNIVDSEETPETILRFFSDNFYNWERTNVLWDLREFNFNTFSTSDIQKIIDGAFPFEKVRDGLKTAYLVASDLGFGMMRILQMSAAFKVDIEYEVFKNFEEAVNWLKS